MKQFTTIAITIELLLSAIMPASAQTSFNMYKKGAHYFMTVNMNGVPDTEVFIETGFTALTLSEENYNRILSSLDLERVDFDENKEMKADRETLKVTDIRKGSVSIGGLRYNGPIYVVKSFDKIALPVHLLKNETDTTANLIVFDFKKKVLEYVSRESLNTKNLKSYPIVRYTPYPTFTARLELADEYRHEGEITGNWIFDLGNGSAVFFFRKSIAPFINKNKFKVFPTRDKSGEIIGSGLLARYCKIGDQEVFGVSIGITNRVWFDYALGCVGPSFFTKGYVVIDSERNTIYYK
ncbi:MAG: hypothetical protein K2O00_02655 [Muribaculaceae bacterium]|nr:hypothetical protein [Muribaculaceae bacterium]